MFKRLNQILIEWDKCAEAFAVAVEDAATKSVEWERFAAKTRIELRADAAAVGQKLTNDDLAAHVLEADIEGLRLDAAMAEAVVSGLRKRLDVFQAQADAARSEIASERAREQAWVASPSVPVGGARGESRIEL